MTGEFEGYLTDALRGLREAGIPAPQELTDEQRHMLSQLDNLDPGYGLTAERRRMAGPPYIAVGDALLPDALWDVAVDKSLPSGTTAFRDTGSARAGWYRLPIFDETHVTTADGMRTVDASKPAPVWTCTDDWVGRERRWVIDETHALCAPVSFRRRALHALCRCWWWLSGLRVAHRSRIDQDGDD
jgi:hypothetical protein